MNTTAMEGIFHLGTLAGVPATENRAGSLVLALSGPSLPGRCDFLGAITSEERLRLRLAPDDAEGWSGVVTLRGFKVVPTKGTEHPTLNLQLIARDSEACDRLDLCRLWATQDRAFEHDVHVLLELAQPRLPME